MPCNFCMWFFFLVHVLCLLAVFWENILFHLLVFYFFFRSLYNFIGFASQFALTIIFMLYRFVPFCITWKGRKPLCCVLSVCVCVWALIFVIRKLNLIFDWHNVTLFSFYEHWALSKYNSFSFFYNVHSPLFYVFYFQQTAIYCCSIVNSLIPQSNQMQVDQTLVANILQYILVIRSKTKFKMIVLWC